MSKRYSSTLGDAKSDFVALGLHQDQALLAVLLTASIAAPLAAAGIFWRDGLGSTTLVSLGLSVALWALWPVYRSRYRPWVAYTLVLALWMGACAAMVAQGSVRSGGSIVLLATLVLAAVFCRAQPPC